MRGIAGDEDAAVPVAVGEQQVLPPRRAGQHLVFDRHADGALELRLHRVVAVDHRMQRPVLGRVLHDQERRFVVGDMIVAALARPGRGRSTSGSRSNSSSHLNSAWRSVSRLPSPDSSMPSCLRTGLAPPSQPTRYCARISSVLPLERLDLRGDAGRVLLERQELAAEAHIDRRDRLGDRFQQRLERVLRDQLIGLERHRAVIGRAHILLRLFDRRIVQMQQRRLIERQHDIDVHRHVGPQARPRGSSATARAADRFPCCAH